MTSRRISGESNQLHQRLAEANPLCPDFAASSAVATKAERHARGFTCWGQFVAMVFYHDVSFQSLAKLPYPDGPKARSKWPDDKLAKIAKYEGTPVRVVGFLVAVKPQSGSAEATNCRFTKAAETDWHMALVEKAGDGEHDSVVVETTPRIRKNHPKWTKGRLAPWTDTNQPVRVSGFLFFDTEHRNHLGKYRSTLWEVHPITKIEVFKGGKWVDRDDIE